MQFSPKSIKIFFGTLGAFLAVFIVVLVPIINRRDREAREVAAAFLVASQQQRYDAAYKLLTEEQQRLLPLQQLKLRWQVFEHHNGRLVEWANIQGGRMNFFPAYVILRFQVKGQRGTGGLWLNMIPENGVWRISTLSVEPRPPAHFGGRRD
jgi:hypothetical protein